MGGGCNNVCKSKYETISIIKTKPEYKKCRVCRTCIKWAGYYCPCCKNKLAMHARDGKSRKKQSVGVVRY